LTFDAAAPLTQTVAVTDGTPGPYAAAGCGGIVTTSVTGATMTVTAIAAGSCTITVTDSAGKTAGLAVTVTTVSVPVQ
jgi:hypothetical protein